MNAYSDDFSLDVFLCTSPHPPAPYRTPGESLQTWISTLVTPLPHTPLDTTPHHALPHPVAPLHIPGELRNPFLAFLTFAHLSRPPTARPQSTVASHRIHVILSRPATSQVSHMNLDFNVADPAASHDDQPPPSPSATQLHRTACATLNPIKTKLSHPRRVTCKVSCVNQSRTTSRFRTSRDSTHVRSHFWLCVSSHCHCTIHVNKLFFNYQTRNEVRALRPFVTPQSTFQSAESAFKYA